MAAGLLGALLGAGTTLAVVAWLGLTRRLRAVERFIERERARGQAE